MSGQLDISNKYYMKYIENCKYNIIIFSTSYTNPVEFLYDIEREIKQYTPVKVCFDLLLCNGDASNRYCEAIMENGRINLSSFRVINQVPSIVRKESRDFYSTNKHFVHQSVLKCLGQNDEKI